MSQNHDNDTPCECPRCAARRLNSEQALNEMREAFAPHGEEAVALSRKVMDLVNDKEQNVHSQEENMVWMRMQFRVAHQMYRNMPHEEVALRLAIIEQFAICAGVNAKAARFIMEADNITKTEINLDKMDKKDAEEIIQNVMKMIVKGGAQ